MRRWLTLAAASLLAACNVTPEIDYHDWSERPHDDSWVPYQLTDTTLVIGVSGPPSDTVTGGTPKPEAAAPAEGPSGSAAPSAAPGKKHRATRGTSPSPSPDATPDALIQPVPRSELYPISLVPITLACFSHGCVGQAVSAASVPIAYQGVTLGLQPARHWFVFTRMAPTYYPNSLRLQTLEFAVEDKREEALQTLGALAVGAAKMSAGGTRGGALPTPLRLPVVIDLADAKQAIGKDQPLPYNPSWSYRVEFLDDPDKAGFLKLSDRSDVHGAVLTSLCRPLRISLSNAETTLVMGVTVADPDYLLSIPLPPTGTVTFGTLCGADVKMQAAVTTPTDKLVNDFFDDVLSVRAALQSGKGK